MSSALRLGPVDSIIGIPYINQSGVRRNDGFYTARVAPDRDLPEAQQLVRRLELAELENTYCTWFARVVGQVQASDRDSQSKIGPSRTIRADPVRFTLKLQKLLHLSTHAAHLFLMSSGVFFGTGMQ